MTLISLNYLYEHLKNLMTKTTAKHIGICISVSRLGFSNYCALEALCSTSNWRRKHPEEARRGSLADTNFYSEVSKKISM